MGRHATCLANDVKDSHAKVSHANPAAGAATSAHVGRKHVGLLLEITIEEGLEEPCRESGDIDQSSFSSNPQ